MTSIGKKLAEKSSNGNSKSSKSKSEKEPSSREIKKPRRNSPGRAKDVVETQNVSPGKKNPNSSSSNFANNLLRQNTEPTDKNLISYSQLSNTAPKSLERGSIHAAKHNEHTLGLSDSSRTHKRKSNSISVLVAQAMELNKDEKSSSDVSDSSTDNSSNSSTDSDTDDKVQDDSDQHLKVMENNKSHSRKMTVASIEKDLTHGPSPINAAGQTKKTHYELLAPSKKKAAKNEDMSDSNEGMNTGANVSLSVAKPSDDTGYVKKQHGSNCVIKQDPTCSLEALQGLDTKMESLIPEIICDFADFMHTLALKVAYQTKYNWSPKCFVPTETDDMSKKPLKKKIHKDPNEPRRPLSSFNLWCEHTRKKLKEEEPNRSIGLQELASMWKLLSPDEKVIWEESAKEQKEIYLKQMEVYKMNSLTPIAP